MNRFVLPVAGSVLAGPFLGGAAVLGITLVTQSDDEPTLTQDYEQSSVSSRVGYGDRCVHGHCLSCNSKQDCLNKLPG